MPWNQPQKMKKAAPRPFVTGKLGKKPPRFDHRTLLMAKYFKPKVALPTAKDWSQKLDVATLGMMLNDSLGDCTCAAMGHLVQTWTANSASEITVSDQDVLAAYEGACGYNPDDPNSDQGGVELDVLNYWRNTGIGGHKIDAYVALEPHNHDHLKAAICDFGGAYLGVALPETAQGQEIWSVVPHAGAAGEPGSWGGHAICAVAYDPHFVTVITWGQLLKMTWSFADHYLEEAYAVLSDDWCANGKAPNGFDMAALQADLAAL